MTRAEWEIIYEMHGIIVEIANNASNYSRSLAIRLAELDKKLLELPIEKE